MNSKRHFCRMVLVATALAAAVAFGGNVDTMTEEEAAEAGAEDAVAQAEQAWKKVEQAGNDEDRDKAVKEARRAVEEGDKALAKLKKLIDKMDEGERKTDFYKKLGKFHYRLHPEDYQTSVPPPAGGTALAALASSGRLTVDIAGTGETIGHIADLKIQNLTDQPFTFVIPPMILESGSGQNQHYACPSGQRLALNPHQTKTVPMNGVCLNRNKPPVGKGVSGDLVMNEANPSSPQNPNSHVPASDANKLLRTCAAKYAAADQLQKSGALKSLPYRDPQKQKDIVVQWSTWMDPVICQMTGSPPATKEDLRKVVYKQVTGPMTTAKKKKVDEGIDAIFAAVELTSAKAKDLEKPPSVQGPLTGEGGKGPTIEETPPPRSTPQPEIPTGGAPVSPEVGRQFDDSVDIKGCKAVSCGTVTKIVGVKGNTIVTCPGNKTCGPAPCACFVYEAPKNDPTARWKKAPITLAGEVDNDPAMDYACFCTN